MTTTIYYLSATGNSLYMARRIQQQLEQTGQVVRLVSIAKEVIRDGAIAVEHLALEAEHLGLGTCWTAWFEQSKMRAAVDAPKGYFIVAVLTLGVPAETPAARQRKSLSEIVSYDHWN